MFPRGSCMPGLAPQPLSYPTELVSARLELDDGATTTLHVARFDRDAVRPRLMLPPRSQSLRTWCAAENVRDAIVGGFFVRPGAMPLGELWIEGMLLPSIPFDSPW